MRRRFDDYPDSQKVISLRLFSLRSSLNWFNMIILSPLVVYCIGIFGLMMLSLLETILVLYLIAKDSQDSDMDKEDYNKQDKVTCEGGEAHCSQEGCLYLNLNLHNSLTGKDATLL